MILHWGNRVKFHRNEIRLKEVDRSMYLHVVGARLFVLNSTFHSLNFKHLAKACIYINL